MLFHSQAEAQESHLHQAVIRTSDDSATAPVKCDAVDSKVVAPHCALVAQLFCKLLWRQQNPRRPHRGGPANFPEERLLQDTVHPFVRL